MDRTQQKFLRYWPTSRVFVSSDLVKLISSWVLFEEFLWWLWSNLQSDFTWFRGFETRTWPLGHRVEYWINSFGFLEDSYEKLTVEGKYIIRYIKVDVGWWKGSNSLIILWCGNTAYVSKELKNLQIVDANIPRPVGLIILITKDKSPNLICHSVK